jgi:diacylglycerol kinase family enzyme
MCGHLAGFREGCGICLMHGEASLGLRKELTTMSTVTTAHVIINQGAGAGDKLVLNQDIEAAFDSFGWQVEFIQVGGHNLQRQTRSTVAQAPGTIVVAGGDGTINTVAAACLEANRPFGILPAGTFNYVARNLSLPTDIPGAVSVIIEGRTRAVDVGEINGQIFLNNAGFGLYSRLVERRELDKQRWGRNRVVAVLSGIRCLLGTHPLYQVEITADGKTDRLLTTTLFFGSNPLQMETFNTAAADCLRHHKLAVLSLEVHSRWEIALAAAAALLGRLDMASNVETFCANSVRVQTRRRALKVAFDGEITMLRPPLDVMLRPGALQIFAPASELA